MQSTGVHATNQDESEGWNNPRIHRGDFSQSPLHYYHSVYVVDPVTKTPLTPITQLTLRLERREDRHATNSLLNIVVWG